MNNISKIQFLLSATYFSFTKNLLSKFLFAVVWFTLLIFRITGFMLGIATMTKF